MGNQEVTKPKAIPFIGIFYLAIGTLYLLTLPITIWVVVDKHNVKYGITAFIWGILPMAILSISSIIFARGLLKAKRWARKALSILSGVYIFYGIISIATISTSRGFHSPIAFNAVLTIISVYAIYYLSRLDVKSWIEQQK